MVKRIEELEYQSTNADKIATNQYPPNLGGPHPHRYHLARKEPGESRWKVLDVWLKYHHWSVKGDHGGTWILRGYDFLWNYQMHHEGLALVGSGSSSIFNKCFFTKVPWRLWGTLDYTFTVKWLGLVVATADPFQAYVFCWPSIRGWVVLAGTCMGAANTTWSASSWQVALLFSMLFLSFSPVQPWQRSFRGSLYQLSSLTTSVARYWWMTYEGYIV